MMNLGPRPTFGDERVSLEVHLFDAAVDLYGRSVRIDFIERLRDTQRFENVVALVDQIGRDAVAARAALALPDARVGASADDSPSG
jgi:riboflavin kinase/FMN adenylyltransferase